MIWIGILVNVILFVLGFLFKSAERGRKIPERRLEQLAEAISAAQSLEQLAADRFGVRVQFSNAGHDQNLEKARNAGVPIIPFFGAKKPKAKGKAKTK